jgi:hypothetical protein
MVHQILLERIVVLGLVEILTLPNWNCLTVYLTSIVQYVCWLFGYWKLRLAGKEGLLRLVTHILLYLIPGLNNQEVALEVLFVRHAGYPKRYSHILAGYSEGCRRGQSSQDYFLLYLH